MLAVSQSGHTVTGLNASPYVYAAKDSSIIGQLTFDGSNYIKSNAQAIAAGAIGNAQFSPGMALLLGSAYLVTTGTTSPVTADTWATVGLYNGIRYYQGISTGLCAWYNGTNWIISSTPGTNGSAYWQGGSTVNSAYTNEGTATGTPTVTAHGNAILAGYQPEQTFPVVDGSGGVTVGAYESAANPATLILSTPANKLGTNASGQVVASSIYGTTLPATVPSLAQMQAGLPTDTSIATDVQTGLTSQGFTTTRAGYLDTLSGLVASIWANTTRTLSAFAFTPNVGGYQSGQDPATLVLGATASSWNTTGTVGHAINAAGTASDPWSTALPGSYGAGSAGAIVGNNLNAAVGSRPTLAQMQAGLPTDASVTADVEAGLSAQGYTTTRAGYLDTLSGMVANIWSYATRALTAFGFNVTVGGYASNQDPATLVLDVPQSAHNGAGPIGNKIGAAASAGDPWSANLPGSYPSGSAGNLVGNDLPALVASMSTANTGITAANTTLALIASLEGNNQGVRDQTYDSSGNILTFNICGYDNPTDAATNNGSTGLISKWAVTLVYTSGVVTNVTTVRTV